MATWFIVLEGTVTALICEPIEAVDASAAVAAWTEANPSEESQRIWVADINDVVVHDVITNYTVEEVVTPDPVTASVDIDDAATTNPKGRRHRR